MYVIARAYVQQHYGNEIRFVGTTHTHTSQKLAPMFSDEIQFIHFSIKNNSINFPAIKMIGFSLQLLLALQM